MPPPEPMTEDWLDDVFAHHELNAGEQLAVQDLRAKARQFAEVISHWCPPCADRTTAVRKVREALMTANAAIALKGRI